MPSFSGSFQYKEENGSVTQSGPCRLTVEEERILLIPEKGPQLALDPGDIDVFSPAEYELSLKIFDGKSIFLSRFGKDFQNLCRELLESFRNRLVQCLLLEDLKEIARFDCTAQLDAGCGSFSSRAELRLYRSTLAVLPESATGFQWRLADIDSVDFDEPTYTLGIRSVNDRLILTRLARRTGEFIDRLQSAIGDVAEESARTLQSLFPFLPPGQFRETADIMKEGRAVALSRLKTIDSRIVPALLKKTVDARLAPYFDLLNSQSNEECLFTGFKLIREEDAEESEQEESAAMSEEEGTGAQIDTQGAAGQREPVLHWFFFVPRSKSGAQTPLNAVAWEAVSRTGRATYYFRLLPEDKSALLKDPAKSFAVVESAVQDLDRALVLLNFRRAPIYLQDASLETQQRYRRYAIACRRIPVLKRLRASFLGRALHTSPEAWQKQTESILERV